MKTQIKEAVESAYRSLTERGILPKADIAEGHLISIPKQERHGDYASNFAMVMSSRLGMAPREVAEALHEELSKDESYERIDVAGPGFLNFFFSITFWQRMLREILSKGQDYGSTDAGRGKKVLVEFVSANPTGPLHIGHGRGAAIGDSLCRILRKAGYQVKSEYYINDVGNQMNNLGLSVYLRYLELLGKDIEFPDECYKGDYIKDIAQKIKNEVGPRFLEEDFSSCREFFIEKAVEDIFSGIKEDLEEFRVSFDNWFSEKTLHDSGFVKETIEELARRGFIYEKDGALWFRTTEFGDEKDRVVKRSNGVLTYFAADIAYHRHKLERDYDLLVNIWGADHHGYVSRVKAAISALGKDPAMLKVLLVQLVSLLDRGKTQQMSTRAGKFITLRWVMDEVGVDATRFTFLGMKCDSHLEFDLDLARKQSQENPVYYVQYAHARLQSILSMAEEKGIDMPSSETADLSLLNDEHEVRLMKHLAQFPEVIAASAVNFEPHRMSYYLTELAGLLHRYYTKHRVIGDDPRLTQARLLLVKGIKIVLKNGLELLGVSAPEKM